MAIQSGNLESHKLREKEAPMFVELHIIQNFAPSNLNRDDTGAPKDCLFGGVRRARISSQCLKRAIRTTFQQQLPREHNAVRTRLLLRELKDNLVARGHGEQDAEKVAEALINSLGLQLASNTSNTEYLLFFGTQEVDRLAEIGDKYWDDLLQANVNQGSKKGSKGTLPAQVQKEALESLDGGKAVDLALFGRMLADLPDRNIDAASQVAHAISTHGVTIEFDYYTAVDDLQPREASGAGMIGTVEFNSATFYRYLNVNLEQLTKNLQGDQQLARKGLETFLKAAIEAVPTGKQNSFAAHNPPSLVFAVVRQRGLWSLANAFVDPARPRDGRDLIQDSIRKLADHWNKVTSMYGADGLQGWVATLEPDQLQSRSLATVESVDSVSSLIEKVLNTCFPQQEAGS